MKSRLFTRALLVIAALFTGVSLFAEGTVTKTKYTSPVYAHINSDVLRAGKPIHMVIQLDNPQNLAFAALPVEQNDTHVYETEIRTSQNKDGKVDVDIIIRCGQINPEVLSILPQVHISKIKIIDIEYITVDNISGVYGTQDIPPTGTVSAKLIRADFMDEVGTSSNISHVEIEVAPLITTSAASKKLTDVTLYPNPVRDGSLNLAFDSEVNISLITVHNAVGALVYQIRPASAGQNISLNLENLNSGIYFVRLETESGEIVKKFNITR